MTATDKILQKTLVESNLDSAGWSKIQAGLRDRAFFSAKVEEVRQLDVMRKVCADFASGNSSISDLRQKLRGFLISGGYNAKENEAGTIKDLTSKARLDVILKQNTAAARGYVNYLDGNTPGAYAAFPCQEFLRTHRREMPRTTWPQRWRDAGGKFYGGRMIAAKDDPVWTRLSVFGTPFPPFDWGSGMGVRDISRTEALRLKVITVDEIKSRTERREKEQANGEIPGLNDGLKANIPMHDDSLCADILREAFGDQVSFNGDVVHWRGELIRDVLGGKIKKASLGIGFNGKKTSFSKSLFFNHAIKHFGDNELRKNNIPLVEGDFELLPTIWRSPDRHYVGHSKHTILELDTLDGNVLVAVCHDNKGLLTFYKTKGPTGSRSVGITPGR